MSAYGNPCDGHEKVKPEVVLPSLPRAVWL